MDLGAVPLLLRLIPKTCAMSTIHYSMSIIHYRYYVTLTLHCDDKHNHNDTTLTFNYNHNYNLITLRNNTSLNHNQLCNPRRTTTTTRVNRSLRHTPVVVFVLVPCRCWDSVVVVRPLFACCLDVAVGRAM